jgi:fatty-acyl-CoA synthase
MENLELSIASARQNGLGDIPRRSAARYPSKTAIIDGELELSYLEFDTMIERVASSLMRHGLGVGDRCAILSHNCWEFAVVSFATARAGIVLVPINFMLTAQEVAYVLEHSEAKAMFAESGLVGVASEALDIAGAEAALRFVIRPEAEGASKEWTSFESLLDDTDAQQTFPCVGDDEPIRLMYTSGTESRPKGALLSSKSLLSQYVSCVVDGGMAHEDVDLHALPLYHCAQMDCFLGPDVYLGATSVIAPGPDPTVVLALIEKHRVTKFFAPPTVWIGLLASDRFDSTDLSSLSKGYYGASPMPVEVLRELSDRLPDVQFWNFYGQTEMSPLATILQPHEQIEFAGSAGRPGLNVETRVVDDDDRQLPSGQVGEIVHRSPHATIGYFKDPEKTAEAFRHSWFHSGDLGYFDDNGYLTVVDRKKDMIKSGGENVASREVEEAIYLMDGVAEVAVFGVPDARWVEAVAAAVVLRDGASATADDVKAHVRLRLAGFKTPKHVQIVDELPKNPSGKILKRVLREALGEGLPQE